MLSLLTAIKASASRRYKARRRERRPKRPHRGGSSGDRRFHLPLWTPVPDRQGRSKFTPKEFRTKRWIRGISKSAAVTVVPKRVHTTIPKPMSSCRGDAGADASKIVNPLSDAQTDHVQDHQDGEQNERSGERKTPCYRQGTDVCSQDKNRNADEIKHDRRHVHHVVRPVAPAGEEP